MNPADDFTHLVDPNDANTYRGLGDAIIESADDAIISKDLNGIIRSWNKGAERLFGYSAEEIVGQSILTLIPPERQHEEPQILARIKNDEAVAHYETERKTKDGRLVHVSLAISPIKDNRGRIVGAAKIARDIGERLDAEHTRAHLAAIVDSADDAIISKDLNGIIRSWNIAAERLFGYDAREAVGRSILLLIPPDRHHEEVDIIGRIRRGQRIEHYETVRRTKDGRLVPVSLTISPIKDRHGRIVGASKIARDNSERIEAEQTRAYLAAIIEAADDAIVGKDLNGIIRSWNRGAQSLFGYSPEEIIGKSVTTLIPPERQAEEPQILARLRRGQRIEHFETIRITKDGRRIPVSLTTSPIKDGRGRIIGASKIARDISDRIAAENALKEADRRKDEFLAMLAHELRNPLMPIRTGIEIIQRNMDSGRREWALQVIDRQLTQLSRIIDDLLDLARITSGNITLQKDVVGLRQLVTQAVDGVRSLIDAARHDLRVELPPQDVKLYVDPMRIVQALMNLLTNSAKFTPPGGSIVITAAAAGGELTLTVRDTGRGMGTELIPRVFDVFVQGNNDYARTEGGLGVGLSIVRRIAELHGGTVTARSKGAGEGSEFQITLPLAEAVRETIAPPPSHDTRPRRAYRVVVVDDNRDATDTLAEILGFDGHEVARHYTGDGVVEKALAFKADVVVLDLGLPGRDGFEVARSMRAYPDLKEVLLIAVTGYGQPADIARSREAGFNFHLLKPINFDALIKLIDENIGPAPKTS